MNKYIKTREYMITNGIKLFRIKAKMSFGDVKKGDLGGWIESKDNLSDYGTSWIYDNAKVFGKARVSDYAKAFGNARIFDNAKVYGNAKVSDYARVFGNANVLGNSNVFGNSNIFGNAWVLDDANVFGNAWVLGEAEVFGDAEVNSDIINLIGICEFSCSAYIQRDIGWSVQIGCKLHTLKEWRKIFKNKKYINLCSNEKEYEKCKLAVQYISKIIEREGK